MLDRTEDTIVALSSAPGRGPRGIVRLDGPRALDVAAALASLEPGNPLQQVRGSTRIRGEVALDGRRTAPAVLYIFRAPKSYTRNDLVEIHTVGSPPLLAGLVERAVACGARRAEPGEFTARAFLSGAMSLPQAEAVAGLIRAHSDRQLSAARQLRCGRLVECIGKVTDPLIELAVLVEADIDFVDEPIEFVTCADLCARLERLDAELEDLCARAVCLERIDEAPRILLIGRANAGKSTLINALAGHPRAICSDTPGTTRDILCTRVRLVSMEVQLLDAAGIDEQDVGLPAQAREAALRQAGHVDAIVLVMECAAEVDAALMERVRRCGNAPMVMALNKRDQTTPEDARRRAAELQRRWGVPAVPVSALLRQGLEELRAALEGVLKASGDLAAGTATLLVNERHLHAVGQTRACLGRAVELARNAAETKEVAELIAFELREALDALGSVTGAVTTDDLLGRIFSTFCIGK